MERHFESLVDMVQKYVKEGIITGRYKANQKIKEEEIAGFFGISRPPVREAFTKLLSEGLIYKKPRRGVFVSEPTTKDMWEVYTLKSSLYELAVDLALEVITDEQLCVLEDQIRKMNDCIEKDPPDLLGYQNFHRHFHKTIMDIAGNDRLTQFAENIHHQVSRYSYQALQYPQHLSVSMEYHQKILKALSAKDKERACSLMRDHVLHALDLQYKILEKEKQSIESAAGGE